VNDEKENVRQEGREKMEEGRGTDRWTTDDLNDEREDVRQERREKIEE
jgi:hypothetical protein